MDTTLEKMLQSLRYKGKIMKERQIGVYLYQIISGIDYMHQRGWFHRDIKPSNIFINVEKEIDVVKVGDWAMAKQVRSIKG